MVSTSNPNSDFRNKMVSSGHAYTHVCMGLNKNGDLHQIGVLLFKADLTLEKVHEQMDSSLGATGYIIAGRALQIDVKPYMVVMNRGTANQCVLGPNRIYFDPMDGEQFKVLVPSDYLHSGRHPI